MDEGVKETLCCSCSHRDVCAHKYDYMHMVKSLQEMFCKFPENEREFMYLRDPDCKFYSKRLSMPRQLTQNEREEILKAVEDGRKSCQKLIAEKISGSIRLHRTNPITIDDMRNADEKIGI